MKKNNRFYNLVFVGLKIQGGIRQETDDGNVTMVAEITKVTPGSIADNGGQLQVGMFSKTHIYLLRLTMFFIFR